MEPMTARTVLVCFSLSACSAEGDVSTAHQGIITPAAINGRANPTPTIEAREVSAVWIPGNGNNVPGRWLMGFNAPLSMGTGVAYAGWSYSTNAAATSWSDHQQTSGTGWGNPGTSTHSHYPFLGWFGDPAMVYVTDPAVNNGGTRAVYANIAASQAPGGSWVHEDIVAAVSSDGGQTWGGATYITTNITADGDADFPFLASNPNPPYHIYATWQSNGRTKYQQLIVDTAGTLTRGPQFGEVPLAVGQAFSLSANIAIGVVKKCSGVLHEAMYVTFQSSSVGHCIPNGTRQIRSLHWWLAVYDTVVNTWDGPWEIASDANWPHCIGNTASTPSYAISNVDAPRIAVDTINPNFWITRTEGTAYGSRVVVHAGSAQCLGSGPPALWPAIRFPFCTPNKNGCNADGTGRNDSMGNPIIEDEWGPAIGFAVQTGVPRVALSWNSTRFDPTHAGRFASTVMSYGENYSSFSAPITISVASTGETVPWDQNLGTWEDYQAMGVNPYAGTFLAAWGGDYRMPLANGGIYTSILQ